MEVKVFSYVNFVPERIVYSSRGLMGRDAVQCCGRTPTFFRTLLSYHNTTCRHDTEDLDLDLHRRENLKSGIMVCLTVSSTVTVCNLLTATSGCLDYGSTTSVNVVASRPSLARLLLRTWPGLTITSRKQKYNGPINAPRCNKRPLVFWLTSRDLREENAATILTLEGSGPNMKHTWGKQEVT